MTTQAEPPFSRPLKVDDVPADGLTMTVEATEAERAALAGAFGIPAVHRLVGTFRISGTPRRLAVEGRIEASVRQICVVSLDPFDGDLTEAVSVTFAERPSERGSPPDISGSPGAGREPPEDIVRGKIDLGGLAAEFLALGLDPYPRKPGVAFSHRDEPKAAVSPFASLAKLKAKLSGDK